MSSSGTPGSAYYQSGRSQTGLLEKIELFLPGFRGYKEKELRRESDKLVRNQIYMKLSDSLSRPKTFTAHSSTKELPRHGTIPTVYQQDSNASLNKSIIQS